MALDVDEDEAWRLLKKLSYSQKIRKNSFGVDTLEEIRDSEKSDEEILDLIIENAAEEPLDED